MAILSHLATQFVAALYRIPTASKSTAKKFSNMYNFMSVVHNLKVAWKSHLLGKTTLRIELPLIGIDSY